MSSGGMTIEEENQAIDENSFLHRANSSGRTERHTALVDMKPSNRYLLPKKRSFAAQYAQVYFRRLQQLRSAVEVTARSTFGPASPTLRYVKSIVDASETIKAERKSKGQDKKEEGNADNAKSEMQTVMVGIIFREMKGKPSILAMYEQPSAHSLIPDPPERARQPFGSATDKVFLEDDQVRCALDLSGLDAQTAGSLVTGLVIAVKGREDRATGAFAVSAIAQIGAAPLPSLRRMGSDEDIKAVVCIVSTPVGHAAQLLLEGLRGTMDGDDDVDSENETECAQSIVQLIVAGNVVGKPPPPSQAPSSNPLSVETAAIGVQPDVKDRQARALRDADAWLSAVSATLPVAVMPGPEDATNVLLPQQALHRCLFPGASRNKNMSRVPNPFACQVNDKLFIGTSGQNVDDVALYNREDLSAGEEQAEASGSQVAKDLEKGLFRADGEKVLDILEMMIMNRHLAPTCPDTLGCFPFTEMDPFVLEASPHVFFVGNQKEFATRLVRIDTDPKAQAMPSTGGQNVQGDAMDVERDGSGQNNGTFIRLISVPRFDQTGQAVFVNVDNLEVSVREYGLNM